MLSKTLMGAAAALLLACCGVHAAEIVQSQADTPAQPWSYAVLFDRSADKAERAEHLARLEAWAKHGERRSRYVLGTLYRLGNRHPARLVAHDYEKAAALLGHAALAGHLQAMAGLAELELAAGKPLAGMMWAQAFVNFSEALGGNGDGSDAYKGWLIHRLHEALRSSGEGDEQTVRETWAGFLQTYGERIAEGVDMPGAMPGANAETPGPGTPPLRQETGGGGLAMGGIKSWRMNRGPREPAYATYVLGVGTDGKIDQAYVIDSAPDPKVGQGMVRNLYAGRYNAIEEGGPLRWGVVTMYFDDGSASLRK